MENQVPEIYLPIQRWRFFAFWNAKTFKSAGIGKKGICGQ